MCVIPVLRRLRQEDGKSQASLGYITHSRTLSRKRKRRRKKRKRKRKKGRII
jgi:hypothetical protein